MQRVVTASVVGISINDTRSQSFCTENVSVLKSDVFVLVVLGFTVRKKKEKRKKRVCFEVRRFCSISSWFRNAQKNIKKMPVFKSDVFVLVVLGFAMRKKKKKKILFSSQKFSF